jgi:hypothetical protein
VDSQYISRTRTSAIPHSRTACPAEQQRPRQKSQVSRHGCANAVRTVATPTVWDSVAHFTFVFTSENPVFMIMIAVQECCDSVVQQHGFM